MVSFIDPNKNIQKLALELELSHIGSLFIGLYDDPKTPRTVIHDLKSRISDYFQFEIQIDNQKVWFPTFFSLNRDPIGKKSNIFHVLNITELTEKEINDLIKYLQYGRERFTAHPYSLVFWLTPQLEKKLFYEAPDFHHWIAGTYDFRDFVVEDPAAIVEEETIPLDKITAYLQKAVHQYDHWQQTKDNGEDFLIEVMGRADLKQYYVPSTYTDKAGQKKTLNSLVDDFLKNENLHFLTLLGDFGIGKSSFSMQYFVDLARKYLSKETDRIPIFVSLKDFAGTFNIEDLIRQEFYERYGIELSFSIFTELALQGRFVIFVDGFDEMTALTSDETAIRNFEELTKLTFENILFLTQPVDAPKRPNKVILTSRTHYFLSEEQEAQVLKTSQPRLYRKYAYKENYILQRIYLNEFDDEQIENYINKHTTSPEQANEYLNIIHDTYNLKELSERPLLLDMIVKTLPTLKDKRQINAADLYKEYTGFWIDREDDKSVLTKTGKRQIMWDLAWQMYQKGGNFTLHYREIDVEKLARENSPLIKGAGGLLKSSDKIREIQPPKSPFFKGDSALCDPEKLRYDLTTCSFLNRDKDGNYKFIHKSFMEYFLAEWVYQDYQTFARKPDLLNKEIYFFHRYLSAPEVRTPPLKVPLDLIYIPPGPFIYGEKETQKVVEIKEGYFIGKHPVTNEQFMEFIKARGYHTKEYWSDEGWKFVQNQKINKPYFWDDEKWNQPLQPVVGISWYEADAFCRWLGGQLPTEEQWEKAARGLDGRTYPWGDEKPTEKLANFDRKVGKTTPIGSYPLGASPYGLHDCAGNVWELCENRFTERRGWRVLRGGSYSDGARNLRAANRYYLNPDSRCGDVGFRVVTGFTL